VYLCAICHRETEPDDVVTDLQLGRHFRWCVCLSCRDRDAGTATSWSPRLEQELAAIMLAAQAHEPPG
jgi:hypothetical protein